jgi:hypothetical protein
LIGTVFGGKMMIKLIKYDVLSISIGRPVKMFCHVLHYNLYGAINRTATSVVKAPQLLGASERNFQQRNPHPPNTSSIEDGN